VDGGVRVGEIVSGVEPHDDELRSEPHRIVHQSQVLHRTVAAEREVVGRAPELPGQLLRPGVLALHLVAIGLRVPDRDDLGALRSQRVAPSQRIVVGKLGVRARAEPRIGQRALEAGGEQTPDPVAARCGQLQQQLEREHDHQRERAAERDAPAQRQSERAILRPTHRAREA
jgi:hypothetical protein